MDNNKIKFLNGSVPALLCFKESPEIAARRGTILFYHGLTVCKETNLKELESLAASGFLAIGIDNAGHGERSVDYSNIADDVKNEVFLEAVSETVNEIPELISELIDARLAYPGKIGICGISMGGFITYGAVALDKRIAAAAPILGSPVWDGPGSPHLTPEKFFPTAVLSQNAGSDECVAPENARNFHKTLEKYYSGKKENIRYIEYPGERHMVSEKSWNALWNEVLSWLDENIK
ncbi:MAG TPA: alpha/beta hydrolase [Candidatus Wallbacteria bacterium]|nr:alpha/beta hydrolase [Candidatus Wallbacteria bacterium]